MSASLERVAVAAVGVERGRRRVVLERIDPGRRCAAAAGRAAGTVPASMRTRFDSSSRTSVTKRRWFGSVETLRNRSTVPVAVSLIDRLNRLSAASPGLERPRLVVDAGPQVLAPVALAGGDEVEVGRQRQRGRRGAVVDAADQRVAPAVQEVLLHGVAHQALGPQAAVDALELGEALDEPRPVVGPRRARPMNAVIDVATPVIVRTPLGTSSM